MLRQGPLWVFGCPDRRKKKRFAEGQSSCAAMRISCALCSGLLPRRLHEEVESFAKDGACDLFSVNPGIRIPYMRFLETCTVTHQVFPLPSYIFSAVGTISACLREPHHFTACRRHHGLQDQETFGKSAQTAPRRDHKRGGVQQSSKFPTALGLYHLSNVLWARI